MGRLDFLKSMESNPSEKMEIYEPKAKIFEKLRMSS